MYKLRKERGWTQEELSEASGVSQGAISAIEKNIQRNLRMSTAVALARALEVPVGDLWPAAAAEDQPVQTAGKGKKEPGMITGDDALAWLARQNKTLAELMRAVQELPEPQRAKVLDHIERQLDLLLSLTESGTNHDNDDGRDE